MKTRRTVRIRRKSKEPLQGVLHFFAETGTEGGDWAFQDKRYITRAPNGRVQWDYAGLHLLRDGDHLTVYDPDDTEHIVWRGTIKRKEHPVFSEAVFGMWIHADQVGTPRRSREDWARMFFGEYPATLVPKKWR